MSKLSNEQDRKNRLLAEATQLVTRGLKTPEDRAEHARLTGELDEVEDLIRMLKRVDGFVPTAPVAAPAVITQRDSVEHRAKVHEAQRRFFRSGAEGLSVEQRALLTTSDAAGSALVMQGWDASYLEQSKFYGPIFNLVHRKDTENGAPTKFVVSDGTNQTFSLVSQGTTSGSGLAQQPTLFSDVANLDTIASSTIFSVQESDDASDLTEFLMRISGLAVARAREVAVTVATTNDGTATVLPGSPAGGFLAGITAGVTQTSGELAAGPTYAQLSALSSSVDRSIFQTGSFMASPSVEAFLRAATTSIGSPLYPVDSEGYLVINGKRLWPNTAMAAIGTASSPLVSFGDYSKAYFIQSAPVQIKVIGNNDESPALSFLTRELLTYTRIGGGAGLSNAVKSLVSAAS
jgi:HK97 family phage major capsid protein